MKKETLLVAIGNQKGGVGKSTVTTLLASYLCYYQQKRVAVIDCDYPQYSIFNMREDDKKTVLQSPNLQELIVKQYEQHQRKAYPIIKTRAEDALTEANNLLERTAEEPFDLILFDLPGTVNNVGILKLVLNLDYIFVPITADKRCLQSSLTYILTSQEFIKGYGNKIHLKSVIPFWNRVDKREHTELYTYFNEILKTEGIPSLKTELPESKKFNKELSLLRTQFLDRPFSQQINVCSKTAIWICL